MKKIIKTIIVILATTLIGVWIILKMPFATDINQDGIVIATSVEMYQNFILKTSAPHWE